MEALEATEVSDDELETEYQEAMAVPTVVKQRSAGKPIFWKPRGRARLARAETHHVHKVDNWAIGQTVTIAWPK